MYRFLLIVFCLFTLINNLKSNNIAISSSVTGRYVIFIESENKNTLLIADNISKQVVDKIDCKKYFIVWKNDSTFLLASSTIGNDSVNIVEYNITQRQKKQLLSYNSKSFAEAYDSKLFAMPSQIKTNEDAFIVFVKEGVVNKYFILQNKITPILNLDKLLHCTDINNISVNSEGSRLLVSCLSKPKGVLYEIDIASGIKKIIASGKEYSNDGSLIFFMKDQVNAVFFKYVANNSIKRVEIIKFNLTKQTSTVLATLDNEIPTLVVDVPNKKRLYIDIIDVRTNIEVDKSKNILEDIFEGIIGRFGILVLDYSSNK